MYRLKIILLAACLMLLPLVVGCDGNGSSNSAEEQAREVGEKARRENEERTREDFARQREIDAALEACQTLPPASAQRIECESDATLLLLE